MIWRYRPVGAVIFLEFQNPLGKVLKKDLENFLRSRQAQAQYDMDLARACDVELWQKEFDAANAAFERAKSPDASPLRGNNPDRDDRRFRDVRARLLHAEVRLKNALLYQKRLAEAASKGGE